MKTKRVNRYYCDFCKKSGGSAGHMRKHEQRCTMNPNRTCGVCRLLEEVTTPMDTLQAALPDPARLFTTDEFGCDTLTAEAEAELGTALSVLRDITNNCPACILAALRQSGIPVPALSDFDFTREMQAVWSGVNERNRDQTYYG